MKRHLFLLMTFIIFIFLIQGCNTYDPTPSGALNVTLRYDATYQYDLGYFGDEEGATISIPPKHFKVNTLKRDINNGKIIYTYFPLPGFTGTDSVELKSMRGSDGASANNNITTIVIKFTITR